MTQFLEVLASQDLSKNGDAFMSTIYPGWNDLTVSKQLEETITGALPLPADQAKFIACMLLAYPLAFILSKLPNIPIIKHIFGMTIGVFFCWFMFQWQILHSLFTATVVYVLTLALPPKLSKPFVFVFVMAYMSLSHIYRMYTDWMGWTMDFTGPQMVLSIKLITFTFDYCDGLRKKEGETLKGFAETMNFSTFPNPLEFYSYVYFFCGFLAGPAFNYREYISYINLELFQDAPNKKMPNPFMPTLRILVLVVFIAGMVQINTLFTPLTYAREDAFYENGFLYRAVYVWVGAASTRFVYYFAWFLSEGSCILAGIGYARWDKEKNAPVWDRARNVNILGVELAQNFKGVTENWNIRTDRWLKHYIYERVGVAPVFWTFFTSALWHGFYPGYYLSFITAGFIVNSMRTIRRNIRSQFVAEEGGKYPQYKWLYDLVCIFATSLSLNYVMAPFLLLSFESSWRCWTSLYFSGHIANLLAFLIASYVFKAPKRPTKQN